MKDILTYPFDPNLILRKKISIRKELLNNNHLIDKKIAILGGSTTTEIINILELFLLNAGIQPHFYESGFNRYYEDVMFDNPELKAFNPDIIFIHTTEVNIHDYPSIQDDPEIIQKKLNDEIEKYYALWRKIKEFYQCLIIQNNFEMPFTRSLGNLDFSNPHGKTNFIMSLNLKIAEYAQRNNNFYINDIHYLSSWFGLEKWFDKTMWYSYKYAFSYEAIPLFCHNLANIIKAVYGKSKKCLVLDLDNTLWGGVIGDDGLGQIQIGKETAIAEAYTAFQQYLKELKERGVMLSVCSKNNNETALEGLSHPDMILKLADFTSFKANWDPKPLNIRKISEEINIGMDSLVFIDDNPAEREIVRQQIPQVEVPNIGEDIVKFLSILDKNGYFELAELTKDDLNRNRYYKENIMRVEKQNQFSDYGDYLISLNMKAEVNSFQSVYLDRITQLINKTNQFNLTTKRYTKAEIERITDDDSFIKLYGRLEDKFGDNGLISIVIGSIKQNSLHIDLWLMSCRVLKRDMELAMFDKLIMECRKENLSHIYGYYYKTEKNGLVSGFYQNLGFDLKTKDDKGDSIWVYSIPAEYKNKNKYIEVKHD